MQPVTGTSPRYNAARDTGVAARMRAPLGFLQIFTLITGASAALQGTCSVSTALVVPPQSPLDEPSRALISTQPRPSLPLGSAPRLAPLVLRDHPAFKTAQTVLPGQPLALELTSNPSTGFEWYVDSPLGEPDVDSTTRGPRSIYAAGDIEKTSRFTWAPEDLLIAPEGPITVRCVLERRVGDRSQWLRSHELTFVVLSL